MTRRVVVTGMGTVNPLSKDVPTYWKGLLAGKSGIAPIQQLDHAAFKVHFGGEVHDWNPEAYFVTKTAKRLDRYAQFSLLA
jgi:3-oxoacyl-[acyl-carrier-protein] synthase II